MSERKDIAIILVGMNTRKFVKDCLDSIAKTDWQGYTHEILYVDNGFSTVGMGFPQDEGAPGA